VFDLLAQRSTVAPARCGSGDWLALKTPPSKGGARLAPSWGLASRADMSTGRVGRTDNVPIGDGHAGECTLAGMHDARCTPRDVGVRRYPMS